MQHVKSSYKAVKCHDEHLASRLVTTKTEFNNVILCDFH